MIFTSLEFFFFFLIVYGAYLLCSKLPAGKVQIQNLILLLSSYFFYAWWDWRFLALIAVSTGVDFFCANALQGTDNRRTRKLLLFVSLATNLGILGFFKYYNFFAESLVDVLNSIGMQADFATLRIILPVGISFYTFQTLSYTIDVYRKQFVPEKNLLTFALYVSFFPQLVAGPIERPARLLPQLKNVRFLNREKIYHGSWLIFWGIYKKLFIADNLAVFVDKVFAAEGYSGGWFVMLGVYAFAFQIFCDFSGYSDIARGLAKLLGIDLVINFRTPYLVTNPRDFWRHWHISLSTWLRDYLYIPLGGSRGSKLQTSRNLVVTMLLGGLWHGANWTFIIWGLYHGLLLGLHRLFSSFISNSHFNFSLPRWLTQTLGIFLMFQLTCIGWLFFRAQTTSQAFEMIVALGNFFPIQQRDLGLIVTVGGSILAHVALLVGIQLAMWKSGDTNVVMRFPVVARALIFVVIFYSLAWFGKFGGKEFIYFQF